MANQRITLYQGANAPAVRLQFPDQDFTGSLLELIVTPAGKPATTFSTATGALTLEGVDTIVWQQTQAFVAALPTGVATKADLFRTIDAVREKLAALDVLVGGIGDFFEPATYVVVVPGLQGLKGDKGDTGDKGDKGDPGDMDTSTYDPNGVAADAFDAANHAFSPTGTSLAATKVQAAIVEALAASKHGFTNSGTGLSSATVQLAIAELAGKVIPTTGTSTPTPTSSSGTLTSASSSLRYEKVGTRVRLTGTVTVTTAGTGAGELLCAIPFTCGSNSATSGNAREIASTGVACVVTILGGEAFLRIARYDNATVIANSRNVLFEITYDAAS